MKFRFWLRGVKRRANQRATEHKRWRGSHHRWTAAAWVGSCVGPSQWSHIAVLVDGVPVEGMTWEICKP